MKPSLERIAHLSRMEEARRQTQRQLDMIDRRIIRRMTALIPQLGRKPAASRCGRPDDPSAVLERYRSHLAAVTAERPPEIDALSRKPARQDAAIEGLRARCGAGHAGPGPVAARKRRLCRGWQALLSGGRAAGRTGPAGVEGGHHPYTTAGS